MNSLCKKKKLPECLHIFLAHFQLFEERSDPADRLYRLSTYPQGRQDYMDRAEFLHFLETTLADTENKMTRTEAYGGVVYKIQLASLLVILAYPILHFVWEAVRKNLIPPLFGTSLPRHSSSTVTSAPSTKDQHDPRRDLSPTLMSSAFFEACATGDAKRVRSLMAKLSPGWKIDKVTYWPSLHTTAF